MLDSMVLAIDIETSGPSLLKNGILSIGYCLGTTTGSVVHKKRIDVRLEPHHEFDPLCLAEFWEKEGPKQVLHTIQQAPWSPAEAIRAFVADLDAYDTQYRLTVLSDNPAFDFYFLSYYMEVYLGRKSLQYKHGLTYRSVVDSASLARGRLGSQYRSSMRQVFPNVYHDHFPDNDAEYIYMCYVTILQYPSGKRRSK
jgi:hypothetical protein